MTTGVLPAQALRSLIAKGAIAADPPVRDDQLQPASLDLRLGTVAYRVRASFLAGKGRTVTDRLEEFTMHKVDLAQGAVLEKNCVYLIPLAERLSLPAGITAVANAKSSSGRLDLLTRTITDGGIEFDRIPEGYAGPLYAEVCPRSFSVLVRAGQRLNQIRFRSGQAVLSDGELLALHGRDPLVNGPAIISEGLAFSVDLHPGPHQPAAIGALKPVQLARRIADTPARFNRRGVGITRFVLARALEALGDRDAALAEAEAALVQLSTEHFDAAVRSAKIKAWIAETRAADASPRPQR